MRFVIAKPATSSFAPLTLSPEESLSKEVLTALPERLSDTVDVLTPSILKALSCTRSELAYR